MPTLEELFRSKQLPSQGGQTAEEAYAVQNSKDIRISSADPLVSTAGMMIARGARNLLGIKGSESLLEEEITGLRIIRTGSIPFIYGSDLARITLRTTPLLDTMKSAANGDLGGGGVLGNTISDARDFVTTKLGIPSAIIPSKVVSDTRLISKGQTQNRMVDLAEIKKSGEGSILGKFLKDGGGGNLKTIGKQALGGAINLAKDRIRGKLFGDRSTTGFNTADPSKVGSNISFNYGSLNNSAGVTIKRDPNTGNVDVQGLMYSKTFNLPQPVDSDESQKLNFIDVSDEGGLAAKTPDLVIDRTKFSDTPTREKKFSSKAKYNRDIDTSDFIETKRGMYQTYDTINSETIFDGDTKTMGDGRTLDEYDFVPLKFTSIHRNKTVQFRSTITGLSETLSPSWSGNKFIGSPFSYYIYDGIERSVTFNFKVYSLNANEHKIAWDKINFLNSLVYPQGYYDSSAVVPPFIKFTLGDMYNKKMGFIESLSHTFDDNTPWNITDKETPIGLAAAGTITGADTEIDMKGYRLPMMADVAVTIKFLESRGTSAGRRFYSFNPQTN